MLAGRINKPEISIGTILLLFVVVAVVYFGGNSAEFVYRIVSLIIFIVLIITIASRLEKEMVL